MSRLWTRMIGVLIGAVLLVLGVRSLVLPAQSACVFLDYVDAEGWPRAPDNPLFEGGELAFAGREPIQLAGRDLGHWDEVVIIDFAGMAEYDAFQKRIAAAEGLDRYHLLEVTAGPPEFLYILNRRLRGWRGDASIDPGPSAPLEVAIPDARYADSWRGLFEGPHRDAIVMLNLIRNRESQPTRVGASDDDATAEELYDRYTQKALRILGKMGAQIAVVGEVDRVVVGPEIRHYDDYGFAYYPSVDAFETVFTAQERIDARVHRDAAADEERSAGYWVKPYSEFAPEAE